jgi:hypothetical protein
MLLKINNFNIQPGRLGKLQGGPCPHGVDRNKFVMEEINKDEQ